MRVDVTSSITAGMALLLAACAGGNGGTFVAMPPSTSTSPSGTSIENSTASLVPGALTPTPALIEAAPNSTGFAGMTGAVTFPMLQTVAQPGSFAGDASATAAGGSIIFSKQNVGISLNFSVPSGTYLSNYVVTNGADLDYTRFGYWYVDDGIDGPFAHGVWNIGFATPFTAIPIGGQASYTGKTTGLYDESHPCGCQNAFTVAFSGDLSLKADFGARALSGSFTNLTITSGYDGTAYTGVLQPTLNNVTFTASLNPSRNWFSGSTAVTNQPAGQQAFTSNASGSITGMFYGPAANEVGGVWTLSDSVRRLIGSFGGKQH